MLSTLLRTARRLHCAHTVVLACAAFAGAALAADEYPSKPIHLLVGFSPGGGLDISCRHWAQELSTRLGQPVVVENKPGASGEIAVKSMITANPDGYTLACLSGSNTISSSKPNAPFDILKDTAPVIQMTRFTFVVYVNPSLPVKTFPELIEYAKRNPGKLNYGSVGIGSTPHLAFEVLKQHAGVNIVHVPFKGTSPAMAAVLSGEVQVGLDAIAAVKQHFDAGKLRPLAVISAKRTPSLPGVPGMDEVGMKGVDINAFSGVAAPARTPSAVVDLLNRHLNAILQEPETRKIFAAQGYEPAGGSPDDFRRVLAQDVTTWSKVIRDANIKFE